MIYQSVEPKPTFRTYANILSEARWVLLSLSCCIRRKAELSYNIQYRRGINVRVLNIRCLETTRAAVLRVKMLCHCHYSLLVGNPGEPRMLNMLRCFFY